MLRRLIYRVVGQPPAADATRADRLRWVRKFYRLNLAGVAVVVVLAAVSGTRFLWVLAAVGLLMWAGGLASITAGIHRAGSRPR